MKTPLKERVRRLTDWAQSRIRHQRYRLEGSGGIGMLGQLEAKEAYCEIRTLEAVLGQLSEDAS